MKSNNCDREKRSSIINLVLYYLIIRLIYDLPLAIRRQIVKGSNDRFKHCGKEFDEMHGLNWCDFHARQYDPLLGRFTSVDPLVEKYYSISHYAYCANNPLRFTDPTGMVIDSKSVDEWNKQRE